MSMYARNGKALRTNPGIPVGIPNLSKKPPTDSPVPAVVVRVGMTKSVESPGLSCAPLNLSQLSQISLFGTKKKK